MKKVSSKIKILISLCAVVLAGVILAVVLLPAFSPKDTQNYSYVAEKQIGIKDVDFDVIIKGDNNEKFGIDSKNANVYLVSPSGKVIFNSRSDDAANYQLASVLNVRLRDKNGNSYTMNSTENSAFLGTFTIESKNDKTAQLVFELFRNEKQSLKGINGADIYARIPLDIQYKDGGFCWSVNMADVKLPEDFVVEKLSILPGLFSVGEGVEDAFYTIPDGCGATMNLSVVSEKPISLNMGMYGSDVAFYEYDEGAVLPFFAMKKNICLVNTIITDGDALSVLSCQKHATSGGYFYNVFNITACGMIDGKLYMGKAYEGVVSQTYYVTEDANADYNEIALRLRENLIKRGYLPEKTSSKFIDYPFFVNVLGSDDGKNVSTTFEDAAEISALLQSRGVRNVALRFSGSGKKGLTSDSDEIKTFSSRLGGKDGFETMSKKITDAGNSTWLDVNLYTERSGNKGTKTPVYDLSSKIAGFKVQKFSLNSTKQVNTGISETYKLTNDITTTDICLNDASFLLYTDLKNDLNRQEVLDNIKEKSGALSVSADLMLSYPAVYLMSEADAVFNIPETSEIAVNDGVTSVPILQMVLHGSVIYGGSYMNVTNLSSEDALLRVIEYGSAPSFLFTHDTASNLNYSLYATNTAKLYSETKSLLPVMDMKMTSHEKVVSGVYKITYDYNKVIYVNYNPSVVEVNGIMISAKDYVVI
ncbi:MAG: hypothetical protein E7530_09980 [Ruminococcaceae bacterium]|nr:hypothetical protein [Oscillospiraceae bacterium]